MTNLAEMKEERLVVESGIISFRSPRGLLLTFLSCIYVTAALWNFFNPITQMAILPIHVYMTTAIVLLAKPFELPFSVRRHAYYSYLRDSIDFFMVVICLGLCIHYYDEALRLQTRMQYIDPVYLRDKFAFFLGTMVLIEAVRRQVGLTLYILLIVFLVYGFFGFLAPGALKFSGFSIGEATDILSMQTNGIFDVPAQVGLDVITFFVIFGAIFNITGGGKVFIDIAFKLTGKLVGGSAKSAVVTSAMFGSVSGSAVANVTTTGVLTIPLMRKAGLSKEQAGATEAIASTGGQLMPPIMGASAFVMAQTLGMSYIDVAMAGLIPALGFYLALFMTIDLGARKLGAVERVEREIPPLTPRLHLLVGPLTILVCLFWGYSANYAAVLGIMGAIVAPFLRRNTWPSRKNFASMVPVAGRQAAEIAVACTSVGIVMAIAIQSGLVLNFVGLLALMGEGNIFYSLVLVIFGCIVMGMGMPTVAAYIVGSVLFVPALLALNVSALSAHYFILYYCVLSMVTPPVALTAYAAAGIAGGKVMKTSLLAFAYGFVIFVIPFGFVRDELLLSQGDLSAVLFAGFGMIMASLSWAICLQNWIGRTLYLIERVTFGALAFFIIVSQSGSLPWYTGLSGFLLMIIWCFASRRLRL